MQSKVSKLNDELRRAREQLGNSCSLEQYDRARARVHYLIRVLASYTDSGRVKVHFE